MTLFAFKDAEGRWRVTHLPPKREDGNMSTNFGDAIMIITHGDSMPVFIDRMGDEVQVSI